MCPLNENNKQLALNEKLEETIVGESSTCAEDSPVDVCEVDGSNDSIIGNVMFVIPWLSA